MRPFAFEAVNSVTDAVRAAASLPASSQGALQFLAGGTTLIDLMKLDVMRPTHVVDINALAASDLGRIEV